VTHSRKVLDRPGSGHKSSLTVAPAALSLEMTFCMPLQTPSANPADCDAGLGAQPEPSDRGVDLQDILATSSLVARRPSTSNSSTLTTDRSRSAHGCSHSAATVYSVGYTTCRFAGISERMMGLEPTTFCMANVENVGNQAIAPQRICAVSARFPAVWAREAGLCPIRPFLEVAPDASEPPHRSVERPAPVRSLGMSRASN
jgi:hypothetical protein